MTLKSEMCVYVSEQLCDKYLKRSKGLLCVDGTGVLYNSRLHFYLCDESENSDFPQNFTVQVLHCTFLV